MNTLSRYLSGRKRMIVSALFLFLLVAPRGLAQIETKVVGDNKPIDTGQYCSDVEPGIPVQTDKDIRDCFLAQAFTLSSGAFVNRITLTLIGNFAGEGAPSPQDYPFLLVITSDLSSCSLLNPSLGPPPFPPARCSGPAVVLVRKESVVIPPSTGHQFIAFSDSFPTIFLPTGTYYLVLSSPQGVLTNVAAFLTWAPNQIASPEVGTLGGSFCTAVVALTCPNDINWYLQGLDPTQPDNMSGTNGTFAFELDGPLVLSPAGAGLGQVLRFLVSGPVTPAPGAPVEANLGFLDMNGKPIGPISTVTVGPGEIQWLDLNLSEFVSKFGKRIEVQPVVTQSPNRAEAPLPSEQLSATVQILDAQTGFAIVLTPFLQPGASVPALVPQVLARGQTMRLNVAASAFGPCNASLSFADNNGKHIGSSRLVNLKPGTGTWLDLNAKELGLTFGKRLEVRPIVTPTPSPSVAPVNSVCGVTVGVFDHKTGRTWTSQSTSVTLPAVQ